MAHGQVQRPAAFLLVVVFLSGSLVSLYGQTLKGTILGTIADSSGAVIPAAQVVIVET